MYVLKIAALGDNARLPVVRKALLAEVRKAEARAAAEAEVEA
jgi:hypothetical protein